MKSFVVAGLGFGDECKGSIVDWLVRENDIKYVCRYNGAFQAAHNVITPEGVHHTFSQFGSGTLASDDVKTLLFNTVIISPESFVREAKTLGKKGVDTAGRVMVSEGCRVATPFHAILNKTYENCRGNGRHGSCGRGVGLTAVDSSPLYAYMLTDREKVISKLESKRERSIDDLILHRFGRSDMVDYINGKIELISNVDVEEIADGYLEFCSMVEIVSEHDLLSIVGENESVFEGAQGVLLDQKHGFFPHVTRSNTTFENAIDILDKSCFRGEIDRVGILRAYHTRHGHGPFPSESKMMTYEIQEDHNGTGVFQGVFRSGHFDAVLAKYALDVVGGVDTLAITCIDKLYGMGNNSVVIKYNCDFSDSIFGGTATIEKLKVCDEIEEWEHDKRNELLDRCTVEGCSVGSVTEGDIDSVNRFIDCLSTIIGRDIDVISTSPTWEGKSRVSKDEKVCAGG